MAAFSIVFLINHMHFLDFSLKKEALGTLKQLITHWNVKDKVNTSRHCEPPSNEAAQWNLDFNESKVKSLLHISGQVETDHPWI